MFQGFTEIYWLVGKNYTLRTLQRLWIINMKLFGTTRRFIRIDKKPVFYASWYGKGVTEIYHLLNESVVNKAHPSFEIFSLLLNEKILCERTIAFKNNTLRKLRAKWTTLCAWAAINMFVSRDVPLLFYFPFSFIFFFIYVLPISYDFSLF